MNRIETTSSSCGFVEWVALGLPGLSPEHSKHRRIAFLIVYKEFEFCFV